ncbi:MAG TPA: amino acid ABC transporter substrate-binding protein [Candidatus Methylomirabilis sp.]|nr:amino acid ABC transporter substrate-binding protein [Candidatus Methylomirabilis sp.]
MESAAVSRAAKLSAIAILTVLACALAAVIEAEAPIRIGATLARTGAFATNGEGHLHGYQLCVKQTNERGGVLGRKLELVTYDDGSDPAAAARLYEKLITEDKVDLVLGPFSSTIADSVATVTERHRMPMVAPTAAATYIYRKGRKFVFSMLPPGEVILEGLLDLAAKKGLKTVALVHTDDSGDRTVRQGTVELARKKGLQVVLAEAFRPETTNFSAILTRVRAANPDVLGVSTFSLDYGVAITRQMKDLGVNPRMVGFTPSTSAPRFQEILGRDAEFVYASATWMPELVEVRAGGLIPIAREYPGAREFVESWHKEFPGTAPTSAAYGACQVLAEGLRRAGALDSVKVRDAISKMDYNTVFGRFRVDQTGVQTGARYVVFQWQDGKRAIVWPEELAPSQPRFPTPPWNRRP